MKILVEIGQDRYIGYVERERSAKKGEGLSVESVFVLMLCLVLASYYVSLNIDYDYFKKRDKGSVEVFLEPLPEAEVKPVMSKRDMYCMALNVYHEAKFEPFLGKVAVANVTYNRMVGGFGRDICKVVFARKQFSWTLRKDRLTEVPSGRGWKESKDAVRAFLDGYKIDELSDVKHYHADYIKKPYWANDMNQKIKIGKHIFYTVRRY